jgi:hypothetical protein
MRFTIGDEKVNGAITNQGTDSSEETQTELREVMIEFPVASEHEWSRLKPLAEATWVKLYRPKIRRTVRLDIP